MTVTITICGGGNAAHTLVGILGGREDCQVRLYAPFEDEAARWQAGVMEIGGITVYTPQAAITGQPAMISRDPEQAVAGSSLVLLALPAFAHEAVLRQIKPYLDPGAWVGALPARGGFDMCWQDILRQTKPGITIFGFQSLPWACRIHRFGQQVKVFGIKQQIDVAVWPVEQGGVVCQRLQELLGVPLYRVASFLSLGLADTGQVIHPGIMYGLFHRWDGQPFPQPRLFYQGVDTDTAAILASMSAEIQSIRSAFEDRYPSLDLSGVRPLQSWLQISYQDQIADPATLETSFTSNRGYSGLLAPMRQVTGGYVPDFQARYLSEDVPYGLVVTRGLAELAGLETPLIDRVLTWAQDRLGKEYLLRGKLVGAGLGATRAPQRYGFTSLESFMQGMRYLSPEAMG